MPTITFDAQAVRHGDLVDLVITRGDQVITSTVAYAKVNTPAKLAAWVLAQRGRQQAAEPTIQRRLTVTFHTETSPEGVDVAVVDQVDHEPLPRDAARAALPTPEQMAGMTAAEVRAVVAELVRWVRG